MAKIIRSFTSALTGAVAAASVMYYFDATSGRRRRVQLAERSASTARRGLSRLRAAGRDLANRTAGMRARASSLLRGRAVTPEIVTERVRAALGRVVSHPGAVHVSVDEAHRVLLQGVVLAWEHEPLLRTVAATPGVLALRDELAAYESAEHVSALQGGLPRRARRPELLQDHWSPGVRLLMAIAGGGLLFGGSRRRGAWGAMGAAAGGALLIRSAINAPLRDIARGRGQHIEVRKSLRVRAPLERVFTALCDYERFPSFMRHLKEVRRRADGSAHWVIAGPWGIALEWDAVITQFEPNRLIAWRTTASSALQHWGLLRLEKSVADEVHLQVYLRYSAPAGRLGQSIARLLRADSRSDLGEDLLRLKEHLEHGEPAAGATSAAARRDAAGVSAAVPEAGRPDPVAPDPVIAAWMEPPHGRTH